ncbi:hypothetical protein PR048_005343 [Dryococelus australis]|uniref:Uncharacterized protein n=1 Tax=Dryococelus australis TaxID=614101 RepID=A0ABQ9I8F8_9NEOP|nr:hypothetical protein PR048_005343 [Dryococelus australis]
MTALNKVRLENIATWNARGIKHQDSYKDITYKIIALAKTHLQAGDTFCVCNYIIHRHYHPGANRGGGAIKKSIQGRNCILRSVYAPLGKTITHENLVNLNNSALTFLALGYLNAKHPSWNCVGKTQNGQLLYNHQQINPYLVCAPEKPTRYPENANYRPDILVITIYKNINFTYELEVLQELHSDHLPVLATLDSANTEATQARKVRNFKKANWPRLNKYVTRNINCEKQLINTTQVQEYTEQLTNVIRDAIEVAILLTTIKKRQEKFSALIKTLSRRETVPAGPGNETDNWITYYKIQQLSFLRAVEWEAKNNALWKCAKKLSIEAITIPPLQKSDGTFAYTPAEKADTLAHTLEKAFQPNETPQCPQHTAHIEQQMALLLACQPNTHSYPTSPEEI